MTSVTRLFSQKISHISMAEVAKSNAISKIVQLNFGLIFPKIISKVFKMSPK